VLDLFRSNLGNFPILTEFAVDITSGGGQRKSLPAGIEVKKWLFFHRIDMNRTSFAVDQGIVGAIRIFPNSTITSLFVAQMTFSRAKMAFDFFIRELLIIAGFNFRQVGRQVKSIEITAKFREKCGIKKS